MGVQVGKYIPQNVYVSVNKSDVNRVAVEATLMENIKLEADIGDDSEGNLILKWKRDY
jgi:autotransporter translocation and assembly factor TamB